MKKVLIVGALNNTISLPPQYNEYNHVLLDSDSTVNPDVLCDACELDTLPANEYNAIYCSHYLEHFFTHDVPKVLAGFLHILKDSGFLHLRVYDLEALMKTMVEQNLDVTDELHQSPAGPITVLEMLYGYSKQGVATDEGFIAHKTGFTKLSLIRLLHQSGFRWFFTKTGNLEIDAIAMAEEPDCDIRQLFNIPSGSTSVKAESTKPSQDQLNALVNLYHSGNMLKAEQECKELLKTFPHSWVVINILGVILQGQGKLHEALDSYNKAIQLKPDYAEAYNNRGNVLQSTGQIELAIESYNKAIQLKPDYAEAYCNRGNTLIDQGQQDAALESYDKAIQLKPDYPEAYYNYGNALKDLGKLAAALENYDKAIQFKPDYVYAYHNRGNSQKELGKLDAAIENFNKAIQLKPDYTEAYSSLLFTLNYSSSHAPAECIAKARGFGEIVAAKVASHYQDYLCSTKPERLRVGFVSGDLRSHPVGYFLESILSCIDSTKIKLIAYPTTTEMDSLTDRIKPCFSSWKPIYDLNDEAAASLIHADGTHVLVDLSGHTAHNRLPMFAWKPAPVQVSWLGYFATTGLHEMDYLLGDPYVTPPEMDSHFSEKVWRLPETRWCFSPPDVDIEVNALPALNNGYITFGCFNNLTKVNDNVVALWSKVLEAVPDSRLSLKSRQFREQSVSSDIIQRFKLHGINHERITLDKSESREKYFTAYHHIDIALDTFPFTGGTTSVEGLWMGVPVLTLEGDRLVSRQGAGILINSGLSDWIAKDKKAYVDKSVYFASSPDKLSVLRAGLRSQVLSSPLFDARRFAHNFEKALWEMWQYQQRTQDS